MTSSLPVPRPRTLERLRLHRPSAERSQQLDWNRYPRRWIVAPALDPTDVPPWRITAGEMWQIPKPVVTTRRPRVPLRTAGRTPL